MMSSPSQPAPSCGRLIVVGTPIGNLGDLSPRAAAALADASVIYCEDTRVTAKLLAHLNIRRRLVRADERTIGSRTPEAIRRVASGEIVAYASDAGMPAISDPGRTLIDAARQADLTVEVVPGPSAAITALVASGIASEHFFFEGFLARKRGDRVRRLTELACVPAALIFYESPHRTVATLTDIAEVLPSRTAALCRELTKLHEEVLRGSARELAEQVGARERLRGEIVIVVAPPEAEELEAPRAMWRARVPANRNPDAAEARGDAASDPETRGFGDAPDDTDPSSALDHEIRQALVRGDTVSAIARRLSQRPSIRRRDVYERALAIQERLASEVR